MAEKSTTDVHTLETAPSPAGQIRTHLRFDGDRYTCQIQAVSSGETLDLFTTLPADPGEDWPASEVVQEVLPQEDDESQFLLGVGRAGKSHWSSVLKQAKNSPVLTFELACRVKTIPVRIGSTFRVQSLTMISSDADSSVFALPHRAERIRWSTLPGTHLRANQELLQFHPEQTNSELPQTVCWGYRLEFGADFE